MLILIAIYRCLLPRFRFIARWAAMGLFIAVTALVIALFAQTLSALKRNHGHWLLHPRSHQPLSPEFIRYSQSNWRLQEAS